MTSLAVASTDEPLSPGQIRFYEATLPPLTANSYQLTVEQQVVGLGDGNPAPTYDITQPFTVTAPRFRLPADTVQMSYPPANATGELDSVLPNIVLRDRVLPWVRTIDGASPPPPTVPAPWMALITLTAQELGIPNSVQTPAPTVSSTVTNLVSPGPGIYGPRLGTLSADTLAEPVLTLTLDLSLFQSVAPTASDLPYLAHVREVNTDHKEILGLDEDGFFAVVIGNRLLQQQQVNYQFLVSLEGLSAVLPPNAPPQGYTQVRLAVLGWWRVTALQSIGNFIEIMQALPTNGGVSLIQSVYTPFTGDDACPTSGPTTPTQRAAQALNLGYAPLESTMRIGEHATAWFRGPAAPVPLTLDPLGPYLRSDAAMRYDPATGIYDMSYAAAWEIGRLLALSSNAMAQSLYLWRRSVVQSLLSAAQADSLSAHLSRTTATARTLTADTARSGTHRALADVLVSLNVPDALASGHLPQRIARAQVMPDQPIAGRCTQAQQADSAQSADPIGHLLAQVFAAS
ncbi:MAG: hypothetical protein ACOVKO_08220, partial [Elstera sp.]